jgi:hypothetical protein
VGAVRESCSGNVRTPPSARRGDVERKKRKERKIKTKMYKIEEEKKKKEN